MYGNRNSRFSVVYWPDHSEWKVGTWMSSGVPAKDESGLDEERHLCDKNRESLKNDVGTVRSEREEEKVLVG